VLVDANEFFLQKYVSDYMKAIANGPARDLLSKVASEYLNKMDRECLQKILSS
jgi:hypothetical protein